MTTETERLARLAATMGLTPAEAVCLPASVDIVQRAGNYTHESALHEFEKNLELQEYVRGCIRRAVRGMAGAA